VKTNSALNPGWPKLQMARMGLVTGALKVIVSTTVPPPNSWMESFVPVGGAFPTVPPVKEVTGRNGMSIKDRISPV